MRCVTFWKADVLLPILVGSGGGELSVLAGWSMKSYQRSSLLWPLLELVRVPAAGSRKLLLELPVP